MKKNRMISLLTAVSLLCMPPLPVFAESADDAGSTVTQPTETDVPADESAAQPAGDAADDYSGRIGDDITWELKDGVLTLTGTGATYSYPKRAASPIRISYKKLIISEGITELGDNILPSTGIETEAPVFPDSLKRIGSNNFANNYFTQITLPPHLESIGEAAFQHSDRVTELVIPDSVNEIGNNAFSGCMVLKQITLPERNIRFGTSVFSGCRRLQAVHLPDAVTEIPYYMFYNCRSLQSVHIPASCKQIGQYAFSQTILSEVEIPASVRTIAFRAFAECKYLSQITMQEGVESLGEECFEKCPAQEIRVPESVTYIGKNCFSDTAVRTLILPTNKELFVEEDALPENWLKTQTGFLILGDGILYQYRDQAEPVEFDSSDRYATSGRMGDDITWKYENNTLYLTGTGATYSYEGMYNPPAYISLIVDKIVIGEGITEIGDCAFFGFYGSSQGYTVKTVIFPDSLRRIGKYNFYCGNALQQLTLPPHLESIGESAFYSSALTELTIPDSVKEIGEKAFAFCSQLKTLHLPESLTEIPEGMCQGCSSLRNISIPAGCTRIGANAFCGASITEIDIPESVREIGDNAFLDCIRLSKITLHEGLEKLGTRCFYNCPAEDVTIPESVKEIGEHCFGISQYPDTTASSRPQEIGVRTSETTYTTAVPAANLPQPAAQSAADETSGRIGDNITWEFKDGILTLTGTGATDSFKRRQDSPFWELGTQLSKIIIGEGITELGDNVFRLTDEIATEIVFPDSLRRIGAYNFNAYSQEELNLPPHLESIGDSAFYITLHLKKLVIPDSVKEIGDDAFADAQELEEVILPDTDIQLRTGVFSGCPQLRRVHLPVGMTEIPDRFFASCSSLCEVNLPPQITSIGTGAFCGTACTAPDIPETVRKIKESAFAECTKLRKITLHEGLEMLGDHCFERCAAKEIRVPESVKSIGESCFPSCVETLILPSHTELQIEENALPTEWLESQRGFLTLGNGILYQYRTDAASEEFVIPEGIRIIYPEAIHAEAVKSVIFPESLREIRSNVLCNSTAEVLTIPAGTEYIADDAFRTCPNLKLIRGEYYSAAHVFARDHQIPFEALHPDKSAETDAPDSESELLSFGNNPGIFGETYEMSDASKQTLQKYTPYSRAETLQEELGKAWSGSCFGLSTVTILAKAGLLKPEMLDPAAKTMHDVKPDMQAKDIINYYQATSVLTTINYFQKFPNERTQFQKLCHAVRCAEAYNLSRIPFLISIRTANDGGHAVVGYGLESGEWTWNDQTYNRRIRIWDSNYEGLDDRCCIYFDDISLRFTLPAYGIVYNQDAEADLGALTLVCDTPQALNEAPHPAVFVRGDLTGDGNVSAEDAQLALTAYTDALAGKTMHLTAAQISAGDVDGNGTLSVEDAQFILLYYAERVIAGNEITWDALLPK